MNARFQFQPLGELCDILDNRRKPITKSDRKQGQYPYYGATGILDYVEGFLFDEPLVLVGEDGAKWASGENTAFAVDGKCWVNNHAHVLRPKNNILLNQWLIHFLVHSDLSIFVSGLTVPKLNQGSLREIPIPLPSISEQQRIVAILDKAFEQIAIARANTEKNLQNARALFESHLQNVFTQRGEGWEEKTLGEICVLRSGVTLDPSIEKSEGEIAYLKVADMNLEENINGITISSRYVDVSSINQSNLLPIGTTIFPKRGGSILTNKKRITKRLICADLNIMGVTPKEGLLPEFLFSYFLGVDMRKLNNGSSVPQINNYTIEPLKILYPSINFQKTIVEKIDSLSKETQRLESLYQRKLNALDALKKSLLHQAFAGEL